MIHTDADDDNDHPSIVANPLLLSVLLCAVATAALPLLPHFSIGYVWLINKIFFVCDYFCILYDCVYAFNVILY